MVGRAVVGIAVDVGATVAAGVIMEFALDAFRLALFSLSSGVSIILDLSVPVCIVVCATVVSKARVFVLPAGSTVPLFATPAPVASAPPTVLLLSLFGTRLLDSASVAVEVGMAVVSVLVLYMDRGEVSPNEPLV
jgi:hypothetical protein